MKPCEKDVKLILNRAKCNLCGDMITSRYRHNFVSCSCKSLSIDGGLSYNRTLFTKKEDFVDMCVYSSESYEKIRISLERGSFGKKGDEPLHWIVLRDISDAHLLSIIEYCEVNQQTDYYEFYLKEKQYRGL